MTQEIVGDTLLKRNGMNVYGQMFRERHGDNMRLIDGDALDWWDGLYMKGVNNSGVWVRYRDVEEFIKNAPTIDAVPVVHGHWMPYEDEFGDCIGIKCSKCGEIYISEYSVEEMAIDYSYCPNCGARMDGE